MGSWGSSRGSLIQLFLDLRDDLGVAGIECDARAELRREHQTNNSSVDAQHHFGAIDDILYCDT
jgi:hypothetical protein